MEFKTIESDLIHETILILDFGSPYTQLIAQRIRANHVFSQIVPYNIPAKEITIAKTLITDKL